MSNTTISIHVNGDEDPARVASLIRDEILRIARPAPPPTRWQRVKAWLRARLA